MFLFVTSKLLVATAPKRLLSNSWGATFNSLNCCFACKLNSQIAIKLQQQQQQQWLQNDQKSRRVLTTSRRKKRITKRSKLERKEGEKEPNVGFVHRKDKEKEKEKVC